jgi:hypothetical protein
LRNDLELSRENEIRLPLLWIAILAGRIEASLGASTGVENAEQVLKYLLAGADAVMITSALLRNGPRYVGELLPGSPPGYRAAESNRSATSADCSAKAASAIRTRSGGQIT